MFQPQKLGMKLLEIAKDMKIKHSVSSSPCKVWRFFFCKKALHGGKNVFGANLWENVLRGGKLKVKRFQSSSQVSFLLIDPDLGY